MKKMFPTQNLWSCLPPTGLKNVWWNIGLSGIESFPGFGNLHACSGGIGVRDEGSEETNIMDPGLLNSFDIATWAFL